MRPGLRTLTTVLFASILVGALLYAPARSPKQLVAEVRSRPLSGRLGTTTSKALPTGT